MANPQVVHSRPHFLNANTLVHGAWDLRPSDYGYSPGPGVAGYEDFRVMQRQAGATMDVDVGKTAVGLMKAWVLGSTRTGQGIYECDNIDWTQPTTSAYVSQLAVTVGANASGNPRLDMVVLEVLDQQHTGSSNTLQLRVVPGTATVGATLDNRTGAAAVPASCIHLADILVANAAASIVTADIRDRRAFPLPGVVSPLLTDVDMVGFRFNPTLMPSSTGVTQGTGADNAQVAALCELPRRIVGATRIRWRYQQGSPAVATNYVIFVCDASGRVIVATAATAFTGAANSVQSRSETIAATTFDAGSYYIGFGLAAMTATSSFTTFGLNSSACSVANTMFRSASGGSVAPGNILGFTDNVTTIGVQPLVPFMAVSVG